MTDYLIPDKTEWAADDPRQELDVFDEEFFRAQYNEWMPREQPPLEDSSAALSPLDKIIYGAIGREHAGNLLDIGCGNGRLTVSLLKGGVIESAVMIDISDEMVKNATQTAEMNGVNPVVVRSSLEAFCSECEYDVILAQEIVEHFFDVRSRLQDISSMLKPAGLFIGTAPRLHTHDAIVHLHYFTRESLLNLLSEYFDDVVVSEFDITGTGEIHLLFLAYGRSNE